MVWIRFYVKEPEVWAENKRQQTERKTEVKAPLFMIFKRQYLGNTINAILWMAAAFCVYYSIWALFSTYLQKELHWTPLMVATPLFWANIVVFLGNSLWGIAADKWGRRTDEEFGAFGRFSAKAFSVLDWTAMVIFIARPMHWTWRFVAVALLTVFAIDQLATPLFIRRQGKAQA